MKHVLMAVLNIMDKKSIIGDLPQFYVFNPNQVERMPISTGFIILVNDKIRMFAEEPQPQEYSIRRTLKYDTSTFHLPRQYTGNSLKSAYFQRIFDVGFVDLHRFYTV